MITNAPGTSGRRRRERLRVRQLAAKVEPADKRECLARAARLRARSRTRQVEGRARTEQHGRALAAGIRGREQEDAMAAHGRASATTSKASFSPCVTV